MNYQPWEKPSVSLTFTFYKEFFELFFLALYFFFANYYLLIICFRFYYCDAKQRAFLWCFARFLSLSTPISKVQILRLSNLRNGTSENVRSNARRKYWDWICTVCLSIFNVRFRFVKRNPQKRHFYCYFKIRDN